MKFTEILGKNMEKKFDALWQDAAILEAACRVEPTLRLARAARFVVLLLGVLF